MSDNFVSLFAGEQSQGIRFKDNSPLTFVGASTRSTGKVGHFNISADGSVAVRKNTSATEALDVNGNALISGNVTVRNDSPNIVVSSSNLEKNFKIGASFSNTPVFTIRNQSDEELLALDGETLSIKGTVDESNIPNLDASKVTTGMFNTDQIPELSADKITSGELNQNQIPDLDAKKNATGTFDTDRIPNLDADKITTGELNQNQIPELSADKITSGEFNSDQIPDLDATKIATGTFDTDRIPDLDADKITTGELNQNQIPELDIAKVSGLQKKLDNIQPSNWEKSNDDIYNSNNGNVGVGTTSPNAKLDVKGSFIVQGNNKTAFGTDSLSGQECKYFFTHEQNPSKVDDGSDYCVVIRTRETLLKDHRIPLQVYKDGTIQATTLTEFSSSFAPSSNPKVRITADGSIHAKNNITADGACCNSSDDRTKHNEKFIKNVTETIMKLRPQIYRKGRLGYDVNDIYLVYKDTNGDYLNHEMPVESGLIAQEIYYDAPGLRHLVHIPEDASDIEQPPADYNKNRDKPHIDPDWSNLGSTPARVNYIGLIPYLIQGFKEQQNTIEAQQKKIEDLTIKLDKAMEYIDTKE